MPRNDRRRHRAGPWHILTVAVVAQVGVSLIEHGVPVLAGFIKEDLGLSAAGVGLVVSAFAFGKIFGSYAAGVAADRLGERRVIVAGGFVAGVLAALAALSPTPLFITLLVAAGVAGAGSTPAGGRLVLLSFPRNRAGIALGIRQTGIPLAGLVAAVLLPWVAHVSSWRWGLAVAAALAILCLGPLALTRPRRDVDVAAPSGERSLDRSDRSRNVILLTIWGCLLVTGQYSVLTFLALDLNASAGLTLATGALFVAVANATGALSRVGWGWVSDHLLGARRKPLVVTITLIALAGALLLLAIPRDAPKALFVLAAVVAGLSVFGYQGLWVTMIAESAGPRRVGAATGFGVTFATASIALSPPLYGLIADTAGSYRAIWAALAIVVALALVPAVLVREGLSEVGEDPGDGGATPRMS